MSFRSAGLSIFLCSNTTTIWNDGRPSTIHSRQHADEDWDKLESAPGEVLAKAYDVVMNGWEIGGGSIRIHRSDRQDRLFAALGISKEEVDAQFGHLIEAFQYGAPPHGGIALGIDRLVALFAEATSIRDVIAFPKTAAGTDLMVDSPSPVTDSQMAELHISLREKKKR